MRAGQYTKNTLDSINDREVGIQADAVFPRHVLANLALVVNRERPENGLYRNAWEAFGNWEAARTDSLEAHERAVIFLATLTVFAVAIYLVGQALGMGRGRAAFVLTGLGIVFVVTGLGLAARTELAVEGAEAPHEVPASCQLDPERWGPVRGGPNALAARQFAIGITTLDNALTSDEYQTAADHLRCAATLRPNFVDANRRLAKSVSADEFQPDQRKLCQPAGAGRIEGSRGVAGARA